MAVREQCVHAATVVALMIQNSESSNALLEACKICSAVDCEVMLSSVEMVQHYLHHLHYLFELKFAMRIW